MRIRDDRNLANVLPDYYHHGFHGRHCQQFDASCPAPRQISSESKGNSGKKMTGHDAIGTRAICLKGTPRVTSVNPFFFLSFPSLSLVYTTMGLLDIVPAGVVTGDNLRKLFNYGIYHHWYYCSPFVFIHNLC